MCRIAGIIDKSSQQLEEDAITMRDAMHRGGPDSCGIYHDADAGLVLGFRRLSIIDLSNAGNQPMQDEKENIVLVFNGEIYNYQSLREELTGFGYHFATLTDTEVIIKAYQCWGTGCFSRFRGMFALALYDKQKGEIILARDHAGIKPLYYYCDDECLYFASEIRAFKALKNKWKENENWKAYLLLFGFLPEPVTTLKDVLPLERGSFKIFDVHTLQQRKAYYYRQRFTEDVTNFETAKDLIRSTLQKAVERHLIADAPLGLFLSGGIDSSLLTLLAKSYKKDQLFTLSIDFDESDFSEKKYQDIIVKQCGSIHQSFTVTRKMFFDDLPDILEAMDQPGADGINTYFISKYAKRSGLKAVLSGVGADELLGGYASFKRAAIVNWVRPLPGSFFNLADLFTGDSYRKISFLKRKDAIGEYLFYRGYFSQAETAALLNADEQEINRLPGLIPLPGLVPGLSKGNRVSYLESNLYMQGQLLKDTDMMGMWHGVEIRVPFLDQDFADAVHQVSSLLKFGHKQAKYLLIESFKNILPREIWDRQKSGFVFPFAHWMKDDSIFGSENKLLNYNFKTGRLKWSRYWAYLLSQQFDKNTKPSLLRTQESFRCEASFLRMQESY